jgi:cobalt-zinc-cadmium efflux system outer membrane protein
MFFVSARAYAACVLSLSLCLAEVAAAAEPISPSGELTLSDAVQATLARNPDLRSFEFELRALDARADIARQRPAFDLSAEIEDVGGTGDLRGFGGAESTFALSSVVELGDKRTRRINAAQVARDATVVERQAAQLDRLAEVTRRFIHVASDQKQLELTQEALRLAGETVAAVKRRVDAAKSPEVELHRAQVEHIRAEVELEHAEHELLSSRVKLAAMWGQTQPTFERVTADLYSLPDPGALEPFVAQLERNPDFLRFASLERLRDAELRLMQAQRRPDIRWSAGIRRLEEQDDQAFVVGFTVPIGSRARAAPGIAEATALSEQVGVQREAAFVNAQAQLFEIYQELQHAITEAATLNDRLLPKMQEALRETQYAYERGRYSYLEFVDAQREYIDVQRSLIEAAANAHTLQAELERLTAQPLERANQSGVTP